MSSRSVSLQKLCTMLFFLKSSFADFCFLSSFRNLFGRPHDNLVLAFLPDLPHILIFMCTDNSFSKRFFFRESYQFLTFTRFVTALKQRRRGDLYKKYMLHAWSHIVCFHMVCCVLYWTCFTVLFTSTVMCKEYSTEFNILAFWGLFCFLDEEIYFWR